MVFSNVERRTLAHIKAFQALLESIQATDTSARISFVHDAIEIECREENKERIFHLLSGGRSSGAL